METCGHDRENDYRKHEHICLVPVASYSWRLVWASASGSTSLLRSLGCIPGILHAVNDRVRFPIPDRCAGVGASNDVSDLKL